MRIVLVRHGKPDIPRLGNLKASEIKRWIDAYNSSTLDMEHKPPQAVIEVAKSCNVVVCSDLLRSIKSSEAIGIQKIQCIEPIFREVGLPYGNFQSPKLPPNIWITLFRMLWFFGYSSNSESWIEAKLRASSGASRLQTIATESESVLLIGHGFMNKFIAAELLATGWKGSGNLSKKYWAFAVYEYPG